MHAILRLFTLIIAAAYSGVVFAQAAPELPVKSYILMDAASGQTLVGKNADEKLPPASITKLMTAYLVVEALDSGKLTMETPITVRQNAYKQEGSRMFIELNKQVRVEDLLQGLIV